MLLYEQEVCRQGIGGGTLKVMCKRDEINVVLRMILQCSVRHPQLLRDEGKNMLVQGHWTIGSKESCERQFPRPVWFVFRAG